MRTLLALTVICLLLLSPLAVAADQAGTPMPPSFLVPLARRADRLEQWADGRLQPGVDNCHVVMMTGREMTIVVLACQAKVAARAALGEDTE